MVWREEGEKSVEDVLEGLGGGWPGLEFGIDGVLPIGPVVD